MALSTRGRASTIRIRPSFGRIVVQFCTNYNGTLLVPKSDLYNSCLARPSRHLNRGLAEHVKLARGNRQSQTLQFKTYAEEV